MAQAGIVAIHAKSMLNAIPHLTADNLFEEPTPTTAEVITWVVLMGIPSLVAVRMVRAAVVSAVNP